MVSDEILKEMYGLRKGMFLKHKSGRVGEDVEKKGRDVAITAGMWSPEIRKELNG